MKCQKCGNEFRGKICPDCGFDARTARKTTEAAQGTNMFSSNKSTLIAIGFAVALILVLVITILLIFEKNYGDPLVVGGPNVVEVTEENTPTAPGVQSVRRGSTDHLTQGADLTGTPLLFEGGGVTVQLQETFLTGTNLTPEFSLLVTNDTAKVKWLRITDVLVDGYPQTQDRLVSIEPHDTIVVAVTQPFGHEGGDAGIYVRSLELTFHVTDDASGTKNKVTDSATVVFNS